LTGARVCNPSEACSKFWRAGADPLGLGIKGWKPYVISVGQRPTKTTVLNQCPARAKSSTQRPARLGCRPYRACIFHLRHVGRCPTLLIRGFQPHTLPIPLASPRYRGGATEKKKLACA